MALPRTLATAPVRRRALALPAGFTGRVALIALAGLVLRLAYTVANRRYPVLGDALTFHLDAAHLADGHGFQRAFEQVPTAEHPPLHILLLAAIDLVGGHGFLAQKLVLCGVGTLSIVAIGFLARRVAGDRAGLVAAAIAATYPLLWTIDGSLMSETPYVLLVALTLLAALHYRSAPSWRRGALVGALIALCTLTRGEAVLLVALLALPLAWSSARGWRPRLAAAGVMVVTFCLVMAPWSVRNLLTFEEPILISTNGYGVFIGANCHRSYYGDLVGSWDFNCFPRTRAPGDESQYSVDYRNRGLRYARAHASRLPKVLVFREARLWDVWRPSQSEIFMASEGRHHIAARWGLRYYWALLPFAVLGVVLLRRRRGPLWPLLAPVAMVTIVGAAIYGSTRFRVAAEPSIVVFAAVALDALVARVRARRARGRDAVAPPERVAAPA